VLSWQARPPARPRSEPGLRRGPRRQEVPAAHHVPVLELLLQRQAEGLSFSYQEIAELFGLPRSTVQALGRRWL